MAPHVSIIILNWNAWKDTVDCLEGVMGLDYPSYSVLVVDNGSLDGSAERVREWIHEKGCSRFTLLESGENLGFAGGCNLGIRKAIQMGADYVFLLNNDAKIKSDILSTIVGVAESADAAITGARILSFDGLKNSFSGARWPHWLFGGGRIDKDGPEPFWPSDEATGCAILIRSDIIHKRHTEDGFILNEKFFMYREESDFCLYARSRGYKCVISRDAVAYHDSARLFGGKGNARSYYYLTRNSVHLAKMWLKFPFNILFHIYFSTSRLLLQSVELLRGKGTAFGAVLHGLVDGYFGVTGKWSKHRG